MSAAAAKSRDFQVQSLLHLFQQALTNPESGDAQLRAMFASTEPFTLADLSRASAVCAISTDLEIIRSAVDFLEPLSLTGDTVQVIRTSSLPQPSAQAALSPPQPSQHPSDHFVLTIRGGDLPASTNEATFAALFENARTNHGNPCPQPTSIRYDSNTKLWVLNFGSEDEMRQAMGASKRMNIEGIPVKARLCFNYDGTISRRDRESYHNPQYAHNMMPPYPAPFMQPHGYPMPQFYPFAYPVQGGVRPMYPMEMMQPYFYHPQMAAAAMYQYNVDPNYAQHAALYYQQYPPRGNKYNRPGAGAGSSAGSGGGAGGGYGGRGFNPAGHNNNAGGYGRGRGYNNNRMYGAQGPNVEHAGPLSSAPIHEERVSEGVERNGEATHQIAASSPQPAASTPEPQGEASGGQAGVVYPIEDGRAAREDDSDDADSQDAADSIDIAPLKVSEAAPSEEQERDRRPRTRPAGQGEGEERRDNRQNTRSRASGGASGGAAGGPRERGGHNRDRSGHGKDRSGMGHRKDREQNRGERDSRGRNDNRGEGGGGERRERAPPAPKLSMEVDFPVLGEHANKAISPQFKTAPPNYAFAVRNDATSASAASPISPVTVSAPSSTVVLTSAAAVPSAAAAPAPAPAPAGGGGGSISSSTGSAAATSAPASHGNVERSKPAEARDPPQESAVAASASAPVADAESTLNAKKSFIDALKAKK